MVTSHKPPPPPMVGATIPTDACAPHTKMTCALLHSSSRPSASFPAAGEAKPPPPALLWPPSVDSQTPPVCRPHHAPHHLHDNSCQVVPSFFHFGAANHFVLRGAPPNGSSPREARFVANPLCPHSGDPASSQTPGIAPTCLLPEELPILPAIQATPTKRPTISRRRRVLVTAPIFARWRHLRAGWRRPWPTAIAADTNDTRPPRPASPARALPRWSLLNQSSPTPADDRAHPRYLSFIPTRSLESAHISHRRPPPIHVLPGPAPQPMSSTRPPPPIRPSPLRPHPLLISAFSEPATESPLFSVPPPRHRTQTNPSSAMLPVRRMIPSVMPPQPSARDHPLLEPANSTTISATGLLPFPPFSETPTPSNLSDAIRRHRTVVAFPHIALASAPTLSHIPSHRHRASSIMLLYD